jgi:hypothetical protein
MSENTNYKSANDNEIDLLDLFRRMGNAFGRMFRALGRAFLFFFVFVIKSWLPLGISILAGVGVSYMLKTASSSFYTSDLVFRNNLAKMDIETKRDNSGTTAEIIAKINKLHTFCLENNKSALTEVLAGNINEINNIADISAFWIIDESKDGIPDYVDYKGNHDVYDTTNIRMQDRLNVRVKINAPQELGLLQGKIVQFIEKDSLFQLRNRLRLRQNQELLKRLGYDILMLDSLQKVKYFEETRNRIPENGGQMIFLQEQKTQLVYTEIHELYARKQIFETDQEIYNNVITVLSDFSLPARRDNGTFYYARFVVPIFFCFVLLILIVIANWKKLKEVYNKY